MNNNLPSLNADQLFSIIKIIRNVSCWKCKIPFLLEYINISDDEQLLFLEKIKEITDFDVKIIFCVASIDNLWIANEKCNNYEHEPVKYMSLERIAQLLAIIPNLNIDITSWVYDDSYEGEFEIINVDYFYDKNNSEIYGELIGKFKDSNKDKSEIYDMITNLFKYNLYSSKTNFILKEIQI